MNNKKDVRISTFIFSQIFIIGSLALTYVGYIDYAVVSISVGVILHGMVGIMEHLKKDSDD